MKQVQEPTQRQLQMPSQNLEQSKIPSHGLRRVRSSPSSRVAVIQPDGLDLCLTCWREWMARDDADLGIKAHSSMRGDGDGFGSDDSAQLRRDNEIAEATDAMIRSLRSSHQWAIRRKCGVTKHSVWNFPQLSFITEAQDACVELETKLRGNIATRLLWL
ncbi:MAG: hypothetical protein ACXW2U_05355 [Telluria sp.]